MKNMLLSTAEETKEKWISMSNSLIRAGHGLSLAEKRVVCAAIAKLDSARKVEASPVVKLTAMEYAESFGLDTDTAYKQLKSAAKDLFSRQISFFPPEHRRGKKSISVTLMRWVGQATYHDSEGYIELHFWHALTPHLIGLKTQFTSYQLEQASALRSIYSWRLLEMLMKFQATGWAVYTMEDFKTSMEAPKSLTDFAQVKRRILEPAIKELVNKDNWEIEWTPVKEGKKVVALKFEFRKNPQQVLPL